eukprot:5423618-Karenia_brevis.AAC.1
MALNAVSIKKQKRNDETGQMEVEEESLDLMNLIEQTAEKAADKAAEKVIDRAVEKAMQTVDAKYDPRLAKLEKEFQSLKKTVTEAVTLGASSAGGVQVNNQNPPKTFVPTKIEVKNICKFKERQEKGYTRQEVSGWLQKLYPALGPYRQHVDETGTEAINRRVLTTSIMIKMSCNDAEGVREVAKAMRELFAKDTSFNFHGVNVPRPT